MEDSNIFKLIIDTMIFCQNKTVDDKKTVVAEIKYLFEKLYKKCISLI